LLEHCVAKCKNSNKLFVLVATVDTAHNEVKKLNITI